MEPRHQIKRLEVDLRVPDQQIAGELQQEFSVFCRTQLTDVLQEAFDSVAPDRYVRIDRLVLTLPSFQDEDEFRSKLAERVQDALHSQLGDALDISAAAARISAGAGPEPTNDASTVSLALSYQAVDVFMHVLRHGIAPWHGTAATFDDIIVEVINLLHTDVLFPPRLLSFLSSSDVILRRFILQIPLAAQRTILALVSANDASVIGAVDQFMNSMAQAFGEDTGQTEDYQLLSRETDYRYLLKGSIDSLQFQSLLEEVVTKLQDTMAPDGRNLTALSSTDLKTEGTMPTGWEAVFQNTMASFTLAKESNSTIKQDVSSVEFTTGESHNQEIDLPQSALLTRVPTKDAAGSVVKEWRAKETVQKHDVAGVRQTDPTEGLPWMSQVDLEELHITNAGLVLLAPFFGVVFKDLGYLDKKGDFISKDERIRAVHFSQFLVTGKPNPPELSLALNKIICGIKVDSPIARFIDLTAAELDAAREVIDSALGHWSALKRTSAPVFQETFLQHQGILTFQGSSWQLRIERTTVDIMLDTLPWTISIIKHPWMQQPVMVEW